MVIELYETEAYVYHQINPLSILVRYSLRTGIVVEVQLKVMGGVDPTPPVRKTLLKGRPVLNWTLQYWSLYQLESVSRAFCSSFFVVFKK